MSCVWISELCVEVSTRLKKVETCLDALYTQSTKVTVLPYHNFKARHLIAENQDNGYDIMGGSSGQVLKQQFLLGCKGNSTSIIY